MADFVPVPNVYPVGRLDFDSEGLDGVLQHRLSDPRFGHARTYWAQVEGLVTPAALEQLAQGVLLQGASPKGRQTDGRTRPCQAETMVEPTLPPRDPPIRFRKNIPTSWLALTITEGRNRQVRRMTAAVGFPTLRLIRVALGTLCLNDLEPGAWRDLERDEVQALLRSGRDSKERPR